MTRTSRYPFKMGNSWPLIVNFLSYDFIRLINVEKINHLVSIARIRTRNISNTGILYTRPSISFSHKNSRFYSFISQLFLPFDSHTIFCYLSFPSQSYTFFLQLRYRHLHTTFSTSSLSLSLSLSRTHTHVHVFVLQLQMKPRNIHCLCLHKLVLLLPNVYTNILSSVQLPL